MLEDITGAIFDMDGTLTDTMYIWMTTGSLYLKSKGIEGDGAFDDMKISTMTLPSASEYFKERYGIDATPEQISDDINKLTEKEYFEKPVLKPGVLEFLTELKEHGVKMCVATTTDRYLAEGCLERVGIRDFFGAIFTSTEVGSGKQSPEIFFQARDFLGTPTESTYVFEDSYYAVQGAKKGGFPVVGVYDISNSRYARNGIVMPDAMIEACDVYVDRLNDIVINWKE